MSKGERAFRRLYYNKNPMYTAYGPTSLGTLDNTIRYCGSCGYALKKNLEFRTAFSRETGERLCVRSIVCSSDIKSGHDTYTDTVDKGSMYGISIVDTDESIAVKWLKEPL